MLFMIQSLQRDLRERIHKLGSSSWVIKVKHISRHGWKLEKHFVNYYNKFQLLEKINKPANN